MYRLDDGRLRNAKKLRDQSVVRARKKCTIGVTGLELDGMLLLLLSLPDINISCPTIVIQFPPNLFF